MMGLKRERVFITTFIITTIILVAVMPTEGAIQYGRWRDITPTHYSADVTGTLRGIYVRSGGTGAIGAGDGWAVGGDTAPVISHYDGFSWRIMASVNSSARYNSVHFCTAPGAPSVGLCSPNGDGKDGWIVGRTATGTGVSLYWDGATLTQVTSFGAVLPINLTSVFMVCHSPPLGTDCPSGSPFAAGLTVAVGSNATGGAIWYFNGDPKAGGGWTHQTVTGVSTDRYNSVYMYVDQSGNLAGFAGGNAGVVARLNSGTWTATFLPGAGPTTDVLGVFVTRGNPPEAWAVGRGGRIWKFQTGSWTGPTTPAGTANDLTSVFFTSTTEGWIAGQNSTILKTTDAVTWVDLSGGLPPRIATGSGITLLGLSFPSGGNGWAVGTQGVILHTENTSCGSIVPTPCWGGSTSITQSEHLNAVYMVGTNDAWAGGNFDNASNTPSLIHWDGNKWHRAAITTLYTGGAPYIWGIYMLSSNEGWAVGGNRLNTTAEALKWTGSQWLGQPISQINATPRDVYMISSSDGWAVGTGGSIWRFQGGSWLGPAASPTTNELLGVFINNYGSDVPRAGWAVGRAGTIITLQVVGGVPSWIAGPNPVPGVDLYDVYFKDSQHGWIVGASGTVLTTSDGGATWSGGTGQVAGAPAATILRSVSIDIYGVGAGNGDGWAVGDDGAGNLIMAHWDGASWAVVPLAPPPTTSSMILYSVFVRGPEDGFAVGSRIDAIAGALSGIIHLDPLYPPTQQQQVTTTVTQTTTSGETTTSTSETTSATSVTTTTSSLETTSETSTQTSEVTTSVVTTTVTPTETMTSSSETTVQTTSSAVTTPLELPAIPGFPWESIVAGIIIGFTTLAILRRRRN